jgi:hypothetical protein
MARSTISRRAKNGECAGWWKFDDTTDRDAEYDIVLLRELVTELAKAARCRWVRRKNARAPLLRRDAKRLDSGKKRLESVGTRLSKQVKTLAGVRV